LPPESPIPPRIVKGAIVALNPNTGVPETPFLIFQYNPETLTHTTSSLNSEEASQTKGKPSNITTLVEQINLTLEFDLAAHLEHPNQHRVSLDHGLHPTLAALESIMHSQSTSENPNRSLILFLWGKNRLLLVSLETLKVVEEAFDPELNPIRAKIELGMRVRDFSEFKEGSIGYAILRGHLERRRLLTQLLYEQSGINPE
jgi:hypothetical protein